MKSYKILIPLLLVAFFLRVGGLAHLPPGLWYDEAYNALDSLWMSQTGHYQTFMVGNNGREPMLHYLLLGSISMLGHTTFAVHWVTAVAGLITIPVMYRFALILLRPFAINRCQRVWLSMTAAGLLAVSWWHLLNSVSGLRPILLPPMLMLALYFFWRGWIGSRGRRLGVRERAMNFGIYLNFVLAGLFLGLSEYTYLPARLAPLILLFFALLWTLQKLVSAKKQAARGNDYGLRSLWLGLLITIFVTALVSLPLGLFFYHNPESFSSRTADVIFAPKTLGEVAGHVLDAVSLFFGAGHELYRHHLPGRAMLGWLEIPLFWVGLVLLLRPGRLKQPETQLIWLGFGIMWLPALLASPPVHSLRPIGLLPFYYLVVVIGLDGLSWGVYYLLRRLKSTNARQAIQNPRYLLPVALAVFIPMNGLINTYDYFERWANNPETYKEYNGPLVDVTRSILDLTQTTDVIIPFHVYVHPTTRYLLSGVFSETSGPPPASDRPVTMMLVPDNFQLLYVGNIPASSAMVWLTRDGSGRGTAYISRLPRAVEQRAITDNLTKLQGQLKPFRDRLGRTVAQFVSLTPAFAGQLAPVFDPTPLRTIRLNWVNQLELRGYDITPNPAQPGQALTLNLYWHSLTEKTFAYRLFLQLIDGSGNPINQWEGDAVSEDMYRWRPDGILPTQHTIWSGPDTPPGPYLVRLGFFDEATGQRLPLQLSDSSTPVDQVQLGLFYVSPDSSDPRQPATPLSVTFADSIKLVGVTLPPLSPLPASHSLPVTIHWQDIQVTDKPYTVFLQLLNDQGQAVAGWDQQPFGGLYPTNLWSPGEIIADTIHLPLPTTGLPPGQYRLITGFYDVTTGQRLPVGGGGDFAVVTEFEVK